MLATISSTAMAAQLYTLSQPATVNIDSQDWTLYATGCTTPVTTISFGNISAGATATWTGCLKNTGAASIYITSNSVGSTLPASVGTIALTQLGSFTLPVQFVLGNTASITLTLTASATAPQGIASFDVQITGFSTSSG